MILRSPHIALATATFNATETPSPQMHDVSHDEIVVVCDSILDSRDELGRRLGLSGAETRALSDSALIRLSFIKWGRKCVDFIDGDFAFACVNRTNREIFLARDHIGTRPLYWAVRGSTFLFSTSIEAMVAFNDVSWKIDPTIIAEYLTLPVSPVSKPFFKDIYSLKPGSTLRFFGTTPIEERWWMPSTKPVRSKDSQDDIVAECTHLLTQAVAKRVRSTRPIGSHFSAGIDSTAITVLAHRALRASDRTLHKAYAWAPPDTPEYPLRSSHDERLLINALSAREGFDVHFGAANRDIVLAFQKRELEFENETDLSDEIPVAAQANTDEIGIMLSGWGGDEAFSSHGPGFIGHLFFGGRFSEAQKFASQQNGSLRSLGRLGSVIWRELLQPLLPAPIYHYSRRGSAFRVPANISKSLSDQHPNLLWRRNSLIKFGINPNRNILNHLWMGHISRRMESWAVLSASQGFQYRYPLMDRNLIEFVLSLSPSQLYMNNQPRGLAREVVSGIVPREANKNDYTNEAFRRDSRMGAWRAIGEEFADGQLSDDCPWIDKDRFYDKASHPKEQDLTGLLDAISVLSTRRVWELHRRARDKGWV